MHDMQLDSRQPLRRFLSFHHWPRSSSRSLCLGLSRPAMRPSSTWWAGRETWLVGDPHMQLPIPPRTSISTMSQISPRMPSHLPPSRPRSPPGHPELHKLNHRTINRVPPLSPTLKFETSWTSPQKSSRLEKTCFARASFQIGGTTPPAPTLAIPMNCRKRTRLERKYGSFIARPNPNYQTKNAWRISPGEWWPWTWSAKSESRHGTFGTRLAHLCAEDLDWQPHSQSKPTIHQHTFGDCQAPRVCRPLEYPGFGCHEHRRLHISYVYRIPC